MIVILGIRKGTRWLLKDWRWAPLTSVVVLYNIAYFGSPEFPLLFSIALDIVVVLAALSSISFLVVYGFGAQWWLNQVGRSLMTQCAVISGSLTFTMVRRLFHATLQLDAGTTAVSLTMFALVILAELHRTWAFWHEIRSSRGALDTPQ